MLYFWITNASRAHRASKTDGSSGSGSPINWGFKTSFMHKRKRKDMGTSPTISSSESNLDRIVQKSSTPISPFGGSSCHIAPFSNGSQSNKMSVSSTSSSARCTSPIPQPVIFSPSKQKLYKRKTSSSSLW